MLSQLSFPELENLGIEKNNFDCEVLGVETFGREADPTVDCGRETNGGDCWILADTMSMSLAILAKENLVSAS